MRTIIYILLLSIAPSALYAKSTKPRHRNDTASYARSRSAWIVSGFPLLANFNYINSGSISSSFLPSYSYMLLRRTELRVGPYSYYSRNFRDGKYWIEWRYAGDVQLRYYTRSTKWFAGAEYMLGRWHQRCNVPEIAEDNSDVWINNIYALVGYSRTLRKNAGKYNNRISWEISNHFCFSQFGYPKGSQHAWLMNQQIFFSLKYHIPAE